VSNTFAGEPAEYRTAHDQLIELRRATVRPTSSGRAMSLAAPHFLQLRARTQGTRPVSQTLGSLLRGC
jgi:hypothetical protein